MQQNEHIIERPFLKEFSYSGCGNKVNYKSYVVINGIRVGKYVSHVEIMDTASYGYPRIKIKGVLDKLDAVTKTSWGIS